MTEQVNINGKDILEDWIYDEIFSDGWMETPNNKKNVRDIIGFYDGDLLHASWVYDTNRICFEFVPIGKKQTSVETRQKLYDYLVGFNNCEGTFTYCEVTILNDNFLICGFYYPKYERVKQ